MVKRGGARSLAADVYNNIRAEIFSGALRPGERLLPVVLSERFETSTTVVREALALLAGERLIQSTAGRGYFIPDLMISELVDVTLVRCHVESLALKMSIERGGVEWEMRVIASHHRLVKTPRRTPEDPDHASQEWSKHHREFHEQLISGCGVPVLVDLCRQLTSATELYRIWAGPTPKAAVRDVEAEHAAIVEATLAGNAELATERLLTHYRTTAEAILAEHNESQPNVEPRRAGRSPRVGATGGSPKKDAPTEADDSSSS
jgi:DNA-binding GntR family transcriptional regulator